MANGYPAIGVQLDPDDLAVIAAGVDRVRLLGHDVQVNTTAEVVIKGRSVAEVLRAAADWAETNPDIAVTDTHLTSTEVRHFLTLTVDC